MATEDEDLDQLELEIKIKQRIKSARDSGDTQGEVNALKDLKSIQSPSDPSRGIGTGEAAVISVGRGFSKAGRGLKTLFNLATGDKEEVKKIREQGEREDELFRSLGVRNPITTTVGTLAGEGLATLPLGLGVGGATVKGTAALLSQPAIRTAAQTIVPRVAGATTGGITEGAVIGAAEGEASKGAGIGGVVGGTLELVLPVVGKILGRMFNRAFKPDEISRLVTQGADGNLAPSPELQIELDRVGVSFDDITKEALTEIPADQQSAAQAAKSALFESEGITPAGRSRITGSSDDAQRAIQLSRQRDSPAADQIREQFFQENQQITQRFNEVAEELGLPAETGATVKGALDNLGSNLNSAKRQAYEDLARVASEADPQLINQIPLETTSLVDTITDVQSFLPDAEGIKLDQLLAKFGVIGEVTGKKGRQTTVDFEGDTITFRGDIKPLNIANTEEFRKGINNIFDLKDLRQASAAREVIGTFDNIVDTAVDGIEVVTDLPKEILDQAKKARGLARAEKLIFSQKDLVDQLKGNKPGTVTPLVEASKVFDKIKTAPVEQVNKLVGTLLSDPNGAEALGNLQSSSVMNFLEAALTGRKTVGQEGLAENIFSGTNLTKSINKFGRGKLNSIFRNQPEVLQRLNNLENIGQLTITPDSAVQKGSAPDLINQLIRASGSTKLSAIDNVASRLMANLQDRAALREFGNLTPEAQQQVRQTVEEMQDFIEFNAPRLTAVLGLTGGLTAVFTEDE